MEDAEFLTPKEARKLLADLAIQNAERLASVRARFHALEAERLALKLERSERYRLIQGFRKLRGEIASGRFKVTGVLDIAEEAEKRGGMRE